MKHKWHKEIKAWADGAEIEVIEEGIWKRVFRPLWTEFEEYRIKPQPKEPQYLYVYKDSAYTMETCSNPDNVIIKRSKVKELKHDYIGKIKLEE